MFDNKLICCKGKQSVVVDSQTLQGERDVVKVEYGAIVAISWRDSLIIGDVWGHMIHLVHSESLAVK